MQGQRLFFYKNNSKERKKWLIEQNGLWWWKKNHSHTKGLSCGFVFGSVIPTGWGTEWDKCWWNRVQLTHRWYIVCQHQSAWNGSTVHSSALGLLKTVGCFWMPQAHRSFQRVYWIEPIYLPLYQLRMHFLTYVSIWIVSLWRIPLHAVVGLELRPWEIVTKNT